MEVSTSRPTQADQTMQDNQVQPNQRTTCNEPPRYDNHSSILTWGNLWYVIPDYCTTHVINQIFKLQ
jgi:hypothetical protein